MEIIHSIKDVLQLDDFTNAAAETRCDQLHSIQMKEQKRKTEGGKKMKKDSERKREREE